MVNIIKIFFGKIFWIYMLEILLEFIYGFVWLFFIWLFYCYFIKVIVGVFVILKYWD